LKSNEGTDKEYVKKAIYFYEKANISEPELPFLQTKLGSLYMHSGQFKKARTHFMTSLDQNDKDSKSAYLLAMMYMFHNNPHVALCWAEFAVNSMSDDISVNTKNDYRQLLESIKSIVADQPRLRFQIGDHVMARTSSGWERGAIVDLWYSEDDWDLNMVSPYQIKLEKGNALIHAPWDEDSHVQLTFSHFSPGEGLEMSITNYESMIAKLKSHQVNEKSLIGRKVKLR
jgi:tetratricopeptide (TPR) repeat protein